MSNRSNKLYPLAHIVCHDKNHTIGDGQNDMPWRCKEDMDIFKRTTLNKVVIMGFNTYQSIPKASSNVNSSPTLSNRIAIVIADPERTKYDPVCRVDIDRLIRENTGREIDGLIGFTVFVPNLDIAIATCRIIHESLYDYKDTLPSWNLKNEDVKAFVIGGGKLYAESLEHAYIKEIHEVTLDLYYVPYHANRDNLVHYPAVDETKYYRASSNTQKSKVRIGSTTFKPELHLKVWKKRVDFKDLDC